MTINLREAPQRVRRWIGIVAIGLSRWRMARLWRGSRPSPRVLVVSPGGVATTMLLKHINRFTDANEPFDLDGWKHIPVPPKQSQKIIYVYGDLDIICANAELRDWIPRQGAKLGQPLCAFTAGKIRKTLYRRAVERQMRAFLTFPTVFKVQYDELWTRIPEIGDFLEINDPAFVATFPARRERLTVLPGGDGRGVVSPGAASA